jgi:hypothetical protein
MTKQQAISTLILNEVANGKTIREAFEAILGEGTYEALANDIYETFQAA